MKKCVFLVLLFVSFYAVAQNNLALTTYKLENGLKVYLLPDANANKTFGAMVVNAGSKNDPADATGLAHYLEHLLFKGTENMGTTNFQKEKPFLDSITTYYLQLAKTTDATKRQQLLNQINEQSIKASQYGLPTEFHSLLSSIGGTGINAFTAPDMTVYHNSFPGDQLAKWLDLYSERFNHPVFRSFQSELEVVYEEKNRGSDNFGQQLIEVLNKKLFPNHPYGSQSTIGTTEHLKNPPINRIYEFFQTYYVANNMALIISGNFDLASAQELIKTKLSTMRTGTVPVFTKPVAHQFVKDEVVQMRISPIKLDVIGFKTVENTAIDEAGLEVCNSLLTNGAQTGLLDQLQLKGKILAAQLFPYHQHDDGAEILLVVPKIIGQSFDKAEGLVFEQLQKLINGEFSDSLLEQVKMEMIRNYEQKMEDPEARGLAILDVFNCQKEWQFITAYPSRIQQLSKQAIRQLAAKYYGAPHVSIQSKTGFPKKDKLSKPGFKPVVTEQKESSAFAKKFQAQTLSNNTPRFLDFKKDVSSVALANGSIAYFTTNPYNKIASLTWSYKIGTVQLKNLDLTASLLNYCSPSSVSLDAFKSQMASINFTYSFSADENFFNVSLSGAEENLAKACGLMDDLLAHPKAMDKAMKNIQESLEAERKQEQKDVATMGQLLRQYVLYGNASPSKDRISLKEFKKLVADSLLQLVQQVLQVPADIHVCTQKSTEELTVILQQGATRKMNRPFQLAYKAPIAFTADKIILVNDVKARQNQVYFSIIGKDYSVQDDAVCDLLNQYLCGSFSGLILQEIREFRSLAYSAGGRFIKPVAPGKPMLFSAYVGCQADKTNESINVMMHLLREMPAYTDRLSTFKAYLKATASTDYPSPREVSAAITNLTYKGFTSDPKAQEYQQIDGLSLDKMLQFYKSSIQQQAVAITIYGDISKINMDELKKQFKNIEILKKEQIATY